MAKEEEEQFGTHIIAASEDGTWRDVWAISPQLLKVAKPIARKLSISVAELLTRDTNGELVAVPEIKSDLAEARNQPPSGFRAPTMGNPDLDRRMRRAAEFYGETPTELAWRAIADEIALAEGSMITDKSGRPIGDTLDLEKFRKREYSRNL